MAKAVARAPKAAARVILQQLDDTQRQLLAPYLEREAQLHREYAENRLHMSRLLGAMHPAVLDPTSGIGFDFGTLEFFRESKAE